MKNLLLLVSFIFLITTKSTGQSKNEKIASYLVSKDSLTKEIKEINKQIEILEKKKEIKKISFDKITSKIDLLNYSEDDKVIVYSRFSDLYVYPTPKIQFDDLVAKLTNKDSINIEESGYPKFWRTYIKGRTGYVLKTGVFGKGTKYLTLQRVSKSKVKGRIEVLTKIYGVEIAEKIISKRYWIGMTSGMARESLGNPDKINRTVSTYGNSEQWVYRISLYLYFKYGKLTTYQN